MIELKHEITNLIVDKNMQNYKNFVRHVCLKSTAYDNVSNQQVTIYTSFYIEENVDSNYIPYENITDDIAIEWIKDRQEFLELEKSLMRALTNNPH